MKFLIKLVLLGILITAGYTIYTGMQVENTDQDASTEISTEEQEFNASGRAKAIESESDLWRVYEGSGVSLKYPGNVEMMYSSAGTEDTLRMSVDVQDTNDFEENAPLGMDKSTVNKNIVALSKGEYGENVDIPFSPSKQVRNLGNTYAQDFVVFGRFEVCSVTFERKLYTLIDGKQVIVTLYGPTEPIMNENHEYFAQDKANCGEETIWNFDKQEKFYNNLVSGEVGGIAQEWYDTFDDIINTIELY